MSGLSMGVVVCVKAGSGNRVEPFPAPGMATGKTLKAKPRPFENTVVSKSIKSVTGA